MQQQELLSQQNNLKNLYVDVGGVTKYLFLWIYPLIKIGNQRALEQEDVPLIRETDGTKWNFQEFKKQLHFNVSQSNQRPFYEMIWKNFKYEFFILLLIQIVLSIVSALNPIIVNQIILLFVEDRPNYPIFFRTYIYFMIYLIILMLGGPAYTFLKGIMQIRVNGALKGLIVDKTLRTCYPLPAQGDMLNLLVVDVQQISQLINSIVDVIMLPFQILMSIYVYIKMMGDSAFVGIIGLSFQFSFNIVYAIYYAKMQVNIMKCKDARMRSVNEMLYGINTIKQNGYYGFFSKKIGQRRFQEMQNIKYQQYLSLLISLISGYGFPILVIYLTFSMFNIFSLTNIIALQQNYFSLVGIVNSIPGLLSTMLVGNVSMNRVMNFLNLKDHKATENDHDNVPANIAISIQNGQYMWHKTIESLTENTLDSNDHNFTLQNISFQIKKGESVLFVGKTGSGKTSLMNAILGELENTGRNVFHINGSISIAQQESWIQQDTILSNILHQESFDQDRLMKVIDTTQLYEDLCQMQSGINSDIGENGSTLSGGQRKRLHLSRALYQDRDIYLLDSPLAALDSKVSFQVAQRLLQSMKGKTLVVFSNSTQSWEGIDRVIMIENGQLIQEGKYSSFVEKSDRNDLNTYHGDLMAKTSQSQYSAIDKRGNKLVDDEDRQVGSIPDSVFKVMYIFFGRWPIALICALSLCLLGMLLNLYYQYFLSELTGIAAQPNTTQEEKTVAANRYLVMFPFLFGAQAILSMTKNLILMLKGITASLILHAKVVDNLLRASVQKFYNVILASRIKNRLSNDIFQFDMGTSGNISGLFDGVFSLLSMFICTVVFSTVYTYPAQVIYIYLIYYVGKYYLKSTIELYRLDALSLSPMLNQFQEIHQGVVYLRHCSDVDTIKTKFFDSVDVQLRNKLSENVVSQWFNQTTNVLLLLIYTIVLVANYQDLKLNEQQASIALYMSIGLSETIFGFVIVVQNFYSNTIFFERCCFLMNQIPREDEYDEDMINEVEQYSDDRLNVGSDVELRTIQSLNIDQQPSNAYALQVTALSAKYRQDLNLVIRDISFTINPREKIAIIGRTGSGKTSLIQCITRLIQYESGSIACYGCDYQEATIDQMRQNYSVISQDPFTFEGTILQNIDPLGVFRSEQEIRKVIGEFTQKNIKILDNMNAEVSELGKNLSLGERQLLVLVRIMLQKRRMVILDECTGNLDQEYSQLIVMMLQNYLKDKTVINVTHKLDTIADSDRVILIDSGSIQCIGTVQEVLNTYKYQQ